MSDTNILDYLREQFSRLNVKLDAVQHSLSEQGQCFAAIEIGMSRVRRDVAGDAENAALASGRIDGIEARLSRVERRLEIPMASDVAGLDSPAT